MLIWILLAVFMVLLGLGVHKKRWYFLISGYNMMSKEEQAKVDIEGVAKAIGWMSYIMAALFIGMGLLIEFEQWNLLWVITIAIIFVPFCFMFYSRRFYPKGMKRTGTGSPKMKRISMGVTVVTLIGAGIIVYFSIQPTKFNVDSEAFEISGMYGDKISWEEISEIQLVNELPEIAIRSNGASVGSIRKGNFKFKNGEKAKLFVDRSVPAFITFTWNDELYYLNKSTVDETEKLYEDMMDVWDGK